MWNENKNKGNLGSKKNNKFKISRNFQLKVFVSSMPRNHELWNKVSYIIYLKTGIPTLKSCLEKRQNLNMPTEDVLHEHHRMYCMTDAAELWFFLILFSVKVFNLQMYTLNFLKSKTYVSLNSFKSNKTIAAYLFLFFW